MKPRGASAVMARRIEPTDSLDDFPTQPWATRALVEHVAPEICGAVVLEPAANRGYMARPLAEYAAKVYASDIHDYGAGYPVADFLTDAHELFRVAAFADRPDWIVTNPPFNKAAPFVQAALQRARQGVAILAQLRFAEGRTRYAVLNHPTPPTIIAQFVERLPLVKGRVDPDADTATAYAWFVWKVPYLPAGSDAAFRWIKPCRKDLERPGDYEDRPGGLL